MSGQSSERDELTRLIAELPSRAVRTAGDEVAFDSAWEIRAFALAVAAHRNGQYDWEEHDTGQQPWRYYDHRLNALESLLTDSGVVDTAEVNERTHTVLTTPRDMHHQAAKADTSRGRPACCRLSPEPLDRPGGFVCRRRAVTGPTAETARFPVAARKALGCSSVSADGGRRHRGGCCC